MTKPWSSNGLPINIRSGSGRACSRGNTSVLLGIEPDGYTHS